MARSLGRPGTAMVRKSIRRTAFRSIKGKATSPVLPNAMAFNITDLTPTANAHNVSSPKPSYVSTQVPKRKGDHVFEIVNPTERTQRKLQPMTYSSHPNNKGWQ